MIMLCGIGTGYLLRNKKMSFIGRVITALRCKGNSGKELQMGFQFECQP